MSRRAVSFFRLARVPVIARDVPVSNRLDLNGKSPAWSAAPSELFSIGWHSPLAQTAAANAQAVRLSSDQTKYGAQFLSAPIAVTRHRDYLLRLGLKLEGGRVSVNVVDENQTRVLRSWNVDLAEGVSGPNQPQNDLNIRFVTDDD